MHVQLIMDKNKNIIWVGDLDGFEDRNYFEMICVPQFLPKEIKIMKDRENRSSYAFLTFETNQIADAFIDKFKNQQRPLSKK